MVSEDGYENQVPTHKYVQSLDDQLRKLRTSVAVIERKLSRFDNAITNINQRRQNND
tara:strand:- start:255 stop:425 length:171 start_codon:yes stop_codon:yes gene_type:complete